MKFYDIMDKEEEGSFISFESYGEAKKWLDDHTEKFSEHTRDNGMHIVENERLTIYERKEKAFAIANNAIYFNDRHDYLSALYDVCKMLNPNIEDNLIGKKFIDES